MTKNQFRSLEYTIWASASFIVSLIFKFNSHEFWGLTYMMAAMSCFIMSCIYEAKSDKDGDIK